MDNNHHARIMREVGALKQIYGESRFKVRAYEDAARTIESLTEPIADVIARDELEELDGIGASLAEDIREIEATGTSGIHTKMLGKFGPGILDLLRVQGLGPKRVKTLWDELGIRDLDALQAAAEGQQIRALSGFGAKTEQNILDEVARLKEGGGRMPLPLTLQIAESLQEKLAALPQVQRVAIAGSIRRGRETNKDIDLLVASDDPAPIMGFVTAMPGVLEVISTGEKKTSVRLAQRVQLDVRVVEPEVFGSALHYFTGSQAHHVKLRARAKRQGMKISEYGVFRTDASGAEVERLASATEQEVFAALGLDYIHPELREGLQEIEQAEAHTLPDLITLEDVRGDLHMHTTASDGKASVREMAEAARALGYDYIAITDHSQVLTVANGLTPARLADHIEHIRAVDAEIEGIRLLTGLEVDILKDGELDMDHDLLRECDWVVGSVHLFQNLDAAAMTDRLVRAITSNLIHAIGHPTGRILGGRGGYEFDWPTILDACLAHDVALEMNGSTGRLDLNAELAARARRHGVRIVFGSDAHSTRGLHAMRFAVQQARRAGFTARDVVNCAPTPGLTATPCPS